MVASRSASAIAISASLITTAVWALPNDDKYSTLSDTSLYYMNQIKKDKVDIRNNLTLSALHKVKWAY